MKRLLPFLLIGSVLPVLAQSLSAPSPKLDVAVKRVQAGAQHGFEVAASGLVQAAPAAVWKTLTTYERMPEFVPNLESTRVLARSENQAIVEQFGSARFLFFRKAIRLVVRVTEVPMSAIDIALVSGDLTHYEAHWELVTLAETGGTRINYRGTIVPDFYIPGMLGASIVREDVTHMMEALLARLDQGTDRTKERIPSPTQTPR